MTAELAGGATGSPVEAAGRVSVEEPVDEVYERIWGPFHRSGFRADLAGLAESSREASRRYAADAVLLARLAAQVPRSSGDERGGTMWTSFLQEVAVARRCSNRTAASEVATATVLVGSLPRMLAKLQRGQLPVLQARALVDSCWDCQDSTLARIDADLADRACRLSPSRLRDAVRKIVLRAEADRVAAKAATAAAVRTVLRGALPNDQAELALTGPALPIAQAWAALEHDARALRVGGDLRPLGALRFDLAIDRLLGDHAPRVAAPAAPAAPTGPAASGAGPAVATAAPAAEGVGVEVGGAEPTSEAGGQAAGAGVPDAPGADCRACQDGPVSPADPTGPEWLTDRRWSRPVRLNITVPVTTALGLDHEPGWLSGYGWVSAPTCRQLLPVAELRQLCTDATTGRLIDLAEHAVRPALTPAAVSAALRDMATAPFRLTEVGWRAQDEHDPGDRLREFVLLRDQLCDGPTGLRIQASNSHLDHTVPYPDGPTAAWNIAARAGRTHQLKHNGWLPVRTETSTLWFSPAGQVVEAPHSSEPLPELDEDAELPDLHALLALEAELLRPPGVDDHHPWPEHLPRPEPHQAAQPRPDPTPDDEPAPF